MQTKFDNWIKENKESISKSEKYSKTINTISNHFKNSIGKDINLYEINNPDEVLELREEYFSYDEFYIKNQTGNRMYSRSLDLYIEFLEINRNEFETILQEIEQIKNDHSLTKLEKEVIILSRIGQGKFRDDLIKLWKNCAISGFEDFRFLIASHIKPWKKSDNFEKVDKYNGILLLPTFDKLFDLGFISFQDSGEIIISKNLKFYDKLGINKNIKIDFMPDHKKYLEYHREFIFKS